MSPLRYIYPAADAPWKPATYGKEDGLGGLRDGIQGEQCQCRLFISALNICDIPLPLEVKGQRSSIFDRQEITQLQLSIAQTRTLP